MGAWGKGLFENDLARDFVSKLMRHIIQIIELDLNDARNDSRLIRTAPAALEVIALLCKKTPNAKFCLSTEQLERWKSLVMGWVDRQLSLEYSEREFKSVRKAYLKPFLDIERCLNGGIS